MTITDFLPAGNEWTVTDLEDLPQGVRAELHNGNLVIMSPAPLWHQQPIDGEKHDALVTMYRRGRNLSGLIEYVEHRQARLSELERDGL